MAPASSCSVCCATICEPCEEFGLSSIAKQAALSSHSYNTALSTQPTSPYLDTPLVKLGGGALFAAGNVLVLTSMWALGVTGTYLGDYFGILMPSMVTGFPFSVVPDPMYVGSSMCFVGVALWSVLCRIDISRYSL